jgi:hypothetical protein
MSGLRLCTFSLLTATRNAHAAVARSDVNTVMRCLASLGNKKHRGGSRALRRSTIVCTDSLLGQILNPLPQYQSGESF